MKAATVALIIRYQGKSPSLVEVLSDDREIHLLEDSVKEADPLQKLLEHRAE